MAKHKLTAVSILTLAEAQIAKLGRCASATPSRTDFLFKEVFRGIYG